MPRKGTKITKPQIGPDPVYKSRLVSKFVNHMESFTGHLRLLVRRVMTNR